MPTQSCGSLRSELVVVATEIIPRFIVGSFEKQCSVFPSNKPPAVTIRAYLQTNRRDFVFVLLRVLAKYYRYFILYTVRVKLDERRTILLIVIVAKTIIRRHYTCREYCGRLKNAGEKMAF